MSLMDKLRSAWSAAERVGASCTAMLLLAACTLAPSAMAAPTDCIGQSADGKAICQPPEVSPLSYGSCTENALSNVENAIGYCNQVWGLVDRPAYSEAPVISASNCAYQRVTGQTNSPVTAFAWKAQGQSVNSFLCWSDTVTWKYGVEMRGYAQQSPPGWYNIVGRRSRTASCRPGETAIYSNGEIEYCSLPVVNGGACTAGNPTKPDLGIKIERSTDYAGAGAHPLSFERLYRSTWYPQLPPNRVGGFWAHNYSASARILPAATYGTRYAFVTRADGEHHIYTNTAGTWAATTATRNALSELRDTAGALAGLQVQIWQDDSTETYDLEGRLLNIRQRNGWTTTLTYSDATTPTTIAPRPGLLINVKNQFGRELKFSYDAQGRMTELLPPGAVSGSGAGSATSPIRYAYDEAASLGPGVAAQGQLSSVTWQDGSVRRYHHEQADVWYIASGPHLLTGVTDEAGVRYATWAYSGLTSGGVAIGARVSRSEHAGGTDRLEFSYGNNAAGQAVTTITDYSSGSAQQTTQTYTDIGNTRMPVSVSAPCTQCSGTAQATTYDATGNPTKQIAHDGSVTFTTYDAKGRETERATFAASFAGTTTRPALASASKVVSSKWHVTWNLPTQLAEPNKTTANTYNSKGMLTGTSWTATTDATGAAKFSAVKTGSTYATGWSYSASSLATTIVTKETAAGATTAVEAGRWTYLYSAIGNLTQSTNVTTGKIDKYTGYDIHGRALAGTAADGSSISLQYSVRGLIQQRTFGSATVGYGYSPNGDLSAVTTAQGTMSYQRDSTGRITGITNDLLYKEIFPSGVPVTAVRVLERVAAMLMSSARAQGIVTCDNVFLIAGSGMLHFYSSNGTLLLATAYTSGLPGITDYRIQGEGPIPPGRYSLRPSEISPATFFRRYIDPRDWGEYRVGLTPEPPTNTFGRSGFMMHGGIRPGSAGCIDVGKADKDVFERLKRACNPVTLFVTSRP